MNRRNFLKVALAASVAPAIVKAENLMPIWVPPERKVVVQVKTLEVSTPLYGLAVGDYIPVCTGESGEGGTQYEIGKAVRTRPGVDRIHLIEPKKSTLNF